MSKNFLLELPPVSDYKFSVFCLSCGERMTFKLYQHTPQKLAEHATIYCYTCARLVITHDVSKNKKQ